VFEKRYYRNINSLSLSRSELLSGYVQSEHVAEEEIVQKVYYRILNNLSLFSPVLHSGIVQSKYVAAVEIVQTKILSEL